VAGLIDAPRAQAFDWMIDYTAYNPTFAGSNVERVRGEQYAEGEVVAISKLADDGSPQTPFLCETAKFVPGERIVWYLSSPEADTARTYTDFSLRDTPEGVLFEINYFTATSDPENAAMNRSFVEGFLQNLVGIFQQHVREKLAAAV
jgi:hypothetical protein